MAFRNAPNLAAQKVAPAAKGALMPVNDDQQKAPSYPSNPLGKPAKVEPDDQPVVRHVKLGTEGTGSFRQVNASTSGMLPKVSPTEGQAAAPTSKHAKKKAAPAKVTLTRGQFIASLVGAAVVAAVPTCLITSCVSQPAEEEPEQTIDWTCVKKNDNGLLQYVKDGVLLSEAGIDVSEHDGSIDWTQVKAAGVDFAMIRVGYRGYGQGTLNLDNYFLTNLAGASEAGLKVGVYFFSQAITADEAQEEAKYVIDNLKASNVELSYPIVFDEEPISDGNEARTDGMSSDQYNANAVAFCKYVEQQGYSAMVYGNQYDLARFDLAGDLAGYPVWYAEYGVNRPTADIDAMTIWQYSESGSVAGITTSDGQVDLDIRFLES